MPFINSKISTPLSKEQEIQIKEKLGKAIELIPGKSENWLMLGFEPETSLYFRGDDSQPTAFVEVSIFGSENSSAFEKLTAEICTIYEEILRIPPSRIYIKYQTTANWGWNGSNL
ncbi:MAG: phenylpyruvate tautomerase MIF-related protein [Ruminococcus flavefaciens]|nr:phenylpyruvate tautomerase MIF-related protein [Ruminococcus flavefaciens]